MYWMEKIDLVKKKYPASDFRDPFREGPGIIEKILHRLLETTWLNFHNSLNRETLLKRGRLVKKCTVEDFYSNELEQFNTGDHFWLLLVNVPLATDFKVYDCKYEPLRKLLYLSSGEPKQEFYIVDKKYAWLQYFKVDRMTGQVEIYEA